MTAATPSRLTTTPTHRLPSPPGAFYHTPLPSAFEYGVRYGLEAATLFMVPFSSWLPALFGRRGVGGGTWLRHIAALPALSDLHLDLPLVMPAQVRWMGLERWIACSRGWGWEGFQGAGAYCVLLCPVADRPNPTQPHNPTTPQPHTRAHPDT